VSESNLSWFHCGRCGGLFQSEPGVRDERVCPTCGADPCPPLVEAAAPAPLPAASAPQDAVVQGTKRTKRSTSKRKNRYFMLQLISGWTLVLVVILLGARKLWHSEPTPAPQPAGEQKTVLSEEDVRLLQTAGAECGRVFEGFLTAGTPETRNQFVLSPVETASRMARFYSMNPLANIRPDTLQLAGSGILHLPDGQAFQARWETTDGRIYDALFRRENNEWRLDWEHFARYSDYPWALFLAGEGPEEGEFRLLARERLAEERKNEPTISIVLYAPRFGSPREVGLQSPEFLVSRDQRDGQLLDAAFKLAREGGRVFGGQLEEINPDGMIRVRVKVRRYEEELERKFEIAGIAACHWYSVNDPGVQPLVRETTEQTEPANASE
jgi:hypothetical protein